MLLPPHEKKIKIDPESCNGKSTVDKVDKSTEIAVSNNTRHRSNRKVKEVKEDDEAIKRKEYRSCEKVGCPARRPQCHANVFARCAEQGYTSRWYHISQSEHFCNECFEYFYRSYKDGYDAFCTWRKLWASNTKMEPTLKAFMTDEILPYWLQCVSCKKWRKLPGETEINYDFITKFKCNQMEEGSKKKSNCCSVPEDKVVLEVMSPDWHLSLLYPPFFKSSPAANFLGPYFPEGVGLSPTCQQCMEANAAYQESREKKESNSNNENGVEKNSTTVTRKIPGLHPNLQPFYQPDEPSKAWCMRPDVMETDELKEFPSYLKTQNMYLGTRNLIIALWNLNFKKWLTLQELSSHLICRGLVRIHCVQLAEKLLKFYTRKGLINLGFIKPPNDFQLIPEEKKESVIVIGSGVSGLSSAFQLTRFGFDVTILEGNDRIGGRIFDDTSMGSCIGKGAQIITGVVNNPLILLSEQAQLPYKIMIENCDLYNNKGEIVNPEMDKKIDAHFNSTLEAVANWKINQDVDVSLYDKFMELSRLKCEENGEKLISDEKALLDFHIGNLEYACGSDLSNLSTLHWDQNEAYPQFAGEHALLHCGYSALLNKFADGLDIKLDTLVTAVDYSLKNQVKVRTTRGEFLADKVIITVPLALLQRECVDFKPALPQRKTEAIRRLGSGIIEKIVVQFPRRFWDKKLKDADMFGYIPQNSSERGLFGVIYDMTRQHKNKENGPHILMTCATGEAVNLVHQKSVSEIVSHFTKVLKKIFKDEDVPEPTNYFVTNWRKNMFAQMAYSYVKVGGTGESYDDLAEAVDNKLFFAGEATNRHFPQTVTGALLSGLREANKITQSVLNDG
uniref:SWIRM domain-containing protein n=1 Tax=Strigamia maritima TaxID=126957 RepID=T1IIN9_STRMM